ncbi:PQQ-binding-like beta-propeller repeat protein [Streptomyces sp. E11-3]|uniref:outer membrane protein assembly factor BamB family protein n=1 Tax=Streptomyces sp. E11-3 TaxID=3110112 RepID=UPI0039802524
MRRIRTGLVGLAVATLVAAAGCSSGGLDGAALEDGRGGGSEGQNDNQSQSPDRQKASKAPELKAYDPPQRFSGSEVGSTADQYSPLLESTLAGDRLYTRTMNGVRVADVATGKIVAVQASPKNSVQLVYPKAYRVDSRREDDQAPFVLEQPGGSAVALAPFHVQVAGQGTSAPRELIELMVVDSETGKLRTSLEIELSDAYQKQPTAARVVGAYGQTVVISVRVHSTRISASRNRQTIAVDLSDPDKPKTVWREAGFEAFAVAGEHVVGATEDRTADFDVLSGLSVKTGEERWQDPTYDKRAFRKAELGGQTTAAAGPNWVVTNKTYGGGLGLVNPATGKYKQLFESAAAVKCHYDQKSVTVCTPRSNTSWGKKVVFALDAKRGDVLWQLPDESGRRVRPDVTTAWHGRVYARTGAGPVVLDARSGKDVETDPGIAPVAVNEYAGLAMTEGPRHRTWGTNTQRISLHHAIG